MTFKEKYRGLYADVYRLHERHFSALTESDWLAFIDDMQTLSDKYSNDKFILGWLALVASEIERVNFPAKARGGQG